MVSFCCNACGRTVKKAQVEKHYQFECRDCNELSCIDCGQDFYGDDYASHTTCISEAEKYQGKLYKPKEKQNKGEHKQQEWLKVSNSFDGNKLSHATDSSRNGIIDIINSTWCRLNCAPCALRQK